MIRVEKNRPSSRCACELTCEAVAHQGGLAVSRVHALSNTRNRVGIEVDAKRYAPLAVLGIRATVAVSRLMRRPALRTEPELRPRQKGVRPCSAAASLHVQSGACVVRRKESSWNRDRGQKAVCAPYSTHQQGDRTLRCLVPTQPASDAAKRESARLQGSPM